jgi:hypothetical protein
MPPTPRSQTVTRPMATTPTPSATTMSSSCALGLELVDFPQAQRRG